MIDPMSYLLDMDARASIRAPCLIAVLVHTETSFYGHVSKRNESVSIDPLKRGKTRFSVKAVTIKVFGKVIN